MNCELLTELKSIFGTKYLKHINGLGSRVKEPVSVKFCTIWMNCELLTELNCIFLVKFGQNLTFDLYAATLKLRKIQKYCQKIVSRVK